MKTVMLLAAVVVGFVGCVDDGPPLSPTTTPAETATVTPTITETPGETRTPTVTRTITHTPSVTPTLGPGANIGFIGVLRADNTVIDPVGVDAQGRAIFERPNGSGFVIVVEAKRGTNNRNPGELSFNSEGAPDLQIQANRPLGDGSVEVCDNVPDNFGGVPAIDPPDFGDTQAIIDALNDFGCRFTDGGGQPVGRRPSDGCVLFSDGEYGFVDAESTLQFCGTVTRPLRFAEGDTIVSARVLDTSGLAGPVRQIVIRALAP